MTPLELLTFEKEYCMNCDHFPDCGKMLEAVFTGEFECLEYKVKIKETLF